MPYRIQEYKIEIIKSATNKEKLKTKNYQTPTVIPIVIYTGKEKWKVTLNLEKTQDKRLKNINMLKYNLIDINNYTKEQLKKSENFMDKIFLIEKTEDTEELTKELSKIIKQVKKEEDKNNLILLMRRILTQKINEKEIEKIINEIKK